jgi:hypothetical protein
VSQQSGGSNWGRAAVLAIAITLIITVPAIRALVVTILEGLK